MSTTSHVKPEKMSPEELLEDGTHDALQEFAEKAMFTVAREALRRASGKAEILMHGAMYNLHLLAGLMSLGSTNPDLGVPRTLRNFGFDFAVILDLLGSQEHLRAHVDTGGMPSPSEGLIRTLGQALKLARQRKQGHQSHGVIITADLVSALIDATATDPLLAKAFNQAGFDKAKKAELRKTLSASNADEPTTRHLSLVTTD